MAVNPTDIFRSAHEVVVALFGTDAKMFASRMDRLADTLRKSEPSPGIVDLYVEAYDATLRPVASDEATKRSSGRSDPTGATVVTHEWRRKKLDEADRHIRAAVTSILAAHYAVRSAQLPDREPYVSAADTSYRSVRPTAEVAEAIERRRNRRRGPFDTDGT